MFNDGPWTAPWILQIIMSVNYIGIQMKKREDLFDDLKFKKSFGIYGDVRVYASCFYDAYPTLELHWDNASVISLYWK